MTLSQITELAYKVMYSAADTAPIGDAYLRIFLNNDNDDQGRGCRRGWAAAVRARTPSAPPRS